ncbi:MAG: hypothetical protein ABL964_09980 [Steroidobacteraceae bacterium]
MQVEKEAADSGSFDMDAAVSSIGDDLGFEISKDEPELDLSDDAPVEVEQEAAEPDATTEAATETPAPVVREMPKSWSKDKAELWSKLPPDAQDYYGLREKQFLDGLEQYKGDATYAKELKDIITPYKALLASQGVDERKAVSALLNVHYRLSQGTPEERRAAYDKMGRDMGLVQSQQGQEQQSVDPVLKKLQDELQSVKSALTARQQAELHQAQSVADREIESFSSDAANAYFDEVRPDMVPYVRSGMSLKDAYDKAVWANPVTRQKELNRLQTEAAAKLKETAKTEGQAARKATSSNVRGVETRKAPTEPKGKMFDDLPAMLEDIKKRSH